MGNGLLDQCSISGTDEPFVRRLVAAAGVFLPRLAEQVFAGGKTNRDQIDDTPQIRDIVVFTIEIRGPYP